MFNFNMLIFKKAPYKYILYNALCILLNIMIVYFIRDEPGEDNPVLLIIGLYQMITFVIYFITRMIYRDEILEKEKDGINIFIESKEAKWKVFLYKALQIFIFNFIQLLVAFLIICFIISSKTQFILLSISFGIGLLITHIIFLFDFTYVNEMNKNFIEEWFMILLVTIPAVIFYYPKKYLFVIYIIILILSIIINIRRIRRNLLC